MSEVFKEYGSVLPCGGKGTRLSSVTGEQPKSLFSVGGKELMRYSADVLRLEVVDRIVFAIGAGGEAIRTWARGANLPHIIDFSEQSEPGVLGAIVAGSDLMREDSMVACNTDEIRRGLDIIDVVGFHESHGKLATMVVTAADHLYRHRLVSVEEILL